MGIRERITALVTGLLYIFFNIICELFSYISSLGPCIAFQVHVVCEHNSRQIYMIAINLLGYL